MSSSNSLSNNSVVGPESPTPNQTEELDDRLYTPNEAKGTDINSGPTCPDDQSTEGESVSQETVTILPSEQSTCSQQFESALLNENRSQKETYIERPTGKPNYDYLHEGNRFCIGNVIIKRVQGLNEKLVHNDSTKKPSSSVTSETSVKDKITELVNVTRKDDFNSRNNATEVSCIFPYETNQESYLPGINRVDIELDVETDYKKTCRLCLKEVIDAKDIFKDRLEENVPIPLAILACIYPIEISKMDPLPKHACCECLEALSNYFKFRSLVLKNDQIQRQKLGLAIRVESGEESSQRKRSLDEDVVPHLLVKRTKISEYETVFEEEDVGSMALDSNIQNILSPPILVPITNNKCTQSESEDLHHVEETLRNLLKKTLTPEQQEAENIIIHVENDKELGNAITTLPTMQSVTLIDDMHREKQRKTVIPGMRKIIEGSKLNVISKEEKSNKESSAKFASTVGLFDSTSATYVYNISFCIANGYLLEYRLVKGNLRYLRCALTTCIAVGTQKVIRPGIFSNKVRITKQHNHHKPTEIDMKKQMFFCVMRKRLQNDKGLNFKSIYEDICKLDPEIPQLVPMSNFINEICNQRWNSPTPGVTSFEQFYDQIESDAYHKIHFTSDGTQFYQEKFTADDNSQAVVFANFETIELVNDCKLMYVDCSFKIDTMENFTYQLLTVLVWVQDSYYPIMFALLSHKSQAIYKNVFTYLKDILMPNLNPEEVITDYEANLYYALGETFLSSRISGSAFYYTQNIYKEICTLNLCRDLETNSYFRNIYHMLLMLPLLPVNTILDGLNNIEIQARDLGLQDMARPLFDHVRNVWIRKVTPELFCVHRMESRINENVVAPFKKLRDFLMLSKGKSSRKPLNIVSVVERIIEVEAFLRTVYFLDQKKWVTRDLNCAQKKSVVKAWQFIETHPKININNFFTKVLGYIKCMENQLWIWGFYRFSGGPPDELIDAENFSIVSTDEVIPIDMIDNESTTGCEQKLTLYQEPLEDINEEEENSAISRLDNVVMEGVIDENGTFVDDSKTNQIDPCLLKFI